MPFVHQIFLWCSYTPVYELISSFLNEADEKNDRAAAILRLGAAEVFIQHINLPGYANGISSMSAGLSCRRQNLIKGSLQA